MNSVLLLDYIYQAIGNRLKRMRNISFWAQIEYTHFLNFSTNMLYRLFFATIAFEMDMGIAENTNLIKFRQINQFDNKSLKDLHRNANSWL